MHMSGPSGDDWCWEKHNILSITSLGDSGWRFTQGPKGFCFTKGLECIVLTLPILPIVFEFVCIQMLAVVQGGPTPSPKIISVSGIKNEPKN